MQVGLHSNFCFHVLLPFKQMEAEHGFLLSGSFPNKVFISVTVIALPISLYCQSFIGIPKAYIQYNPANAHPLGEYELG